MAGFSAADAAFTGFRVVWERPWAVAIWAGLQFVANFALNVFMVASAGPLLMRFSQLRASGATPDPNTVFDLFRQFAPTYVVMLIGALVLTAVLYAAMNRAVMRPAESRFGYLRLASDELRQLGLLAALLALALGLYIALVIAAMLVAVLLGLALGQAGAALAVAGLLGAVLVGFIYVGVRFSLASPMTFATGRINVFGSWRLTEGRFWPLFGTYLIAVALSIFVGVLTLAIAVGAVAIMGGVSAIGAVLQPDTSSLAAAFTPARIVYMAIASIGSALAAPITMCPPAAIYQSLTGGGPGAVSKVFD